MPYILVRLQAPAPIQANMLFPVNLGFGSDKIESVRLLQYWGTGLASSFPFLLSFRGQSQTPMMGNVTTSAFPLFWKAFPTSKEQLRHPIEMAGHGFLNGSGRVDLQISSADPATLPTFSNLFLFFEINYLTSPTYPLPLKDLEWALMQH
jgi:hypothetical protein